MTLKSDSPPAAAPTYSPQALARMLRHEIGDFLQRLYATIAILDNRLPPEWDLEREKLQRLHQRGEACRQILDALQDFLYPAVPSLETFDLVPTISEAVNQLRAARPDVAISVDGAGAAWVNADPNCVIRIAEILFANVKEASCTRVTVRMSPVGDKVEWITADNGPVLPAEVSSRLFEPFFSTKAGHAGLGLALARKFIVAQQGEVEAHPTPKGGLEIRILLPKGTTN